MSNLHLIRQRDMQVRQQTFGTIGVLSVIQSSVVSMGSQHNQMPGTTRDALCRAGLMTSIASDTPTG